MKILEIRRHTTREYSGQHISQAGVTLARRLGEGMGPFDRVITSTVPRAIETAIAMGFAVDEQDELISSYGQDVENEAPWPQPFAGYAAAARKGGAVRRYMDRLAAFYRKLVESLPEEGAALVINHGGIVEMSAVACFTAEDYGSFGQHCEYCEGVRLFWDVDQFVRAEIIRVQ